MNLTYTHDGAGNVKTISGVSRTPLSPGVTGYTHTANKLNGSTGKVAKIYTHDDAGNIISDGGRTFVYNQNSRLVQVKNGETVIAEYAYDGFGRRVKKTVGSEIVHYHYDLAGQLICETDGSGDAIRDYVYLNGEPVAMQLYGDDAGWYYFLNDHLGTPQKVVDGVGDVVWEAGYLPFGEARLLVADIENNLRFPGQYYDSETGLHYNWNRYYDPETGRYLRADPIGLSGGINLFGYADVNPVSLIDPLGLMAGAVAVGGVFGPSPAAHPVFQPGTPQNKAIAGDVKAIISLMNPLPLIRDVMSLMPSSDSGESGGGGCDISGETTPGMPNPEDPDDDPSSNLSKRSEKHISKHIDEFKQYDSSWNLDKSINLGRRIVKPENLISAPDAKQSTYQSVVKIGDKNLTVRAVLNRAGKLRSVHIRY